MRGLFSNFPHGWQGLGLLMLRAAFGITAVVQGVRCLPVMSATASSPASQWILSIALVLSGAALVIGFLAPAAAVVIGVFFLLTSFGWLPEPANGLHYARFTEIRVAIAAISLALLGPGAFSADAYLFGRREIVIPPSQRPPQS